MTDRAASNKDTSDSAPGFEPKASVEWFSLGVLLHTGIKAAISPTFGSFMDKREMQAALHQQHDAWYADHSDKDEIWLDYVADLADGFNPTYTVASLLAKETLELDGKETKKADIIVMGGDEVYPSPSREEYENRLIGPYEAAFNKSETSKISELYAIPGNHDWFDGLTNFLKFFTQNRSYKSLQTKQHRSYFAIKLSHKVWLFGTDIQLDSDVDEYQLTYFRELLTDTTKVKNGSRIILCTAEPAWIYHTRRDDHTYKNLKYFEKMIENESGRDVRQILTLAGDLHNYCRYSAANDRHKITAGGGGAFLHPTHNLPTRITNTREGELTQEEVYPEPAKSKSIAGRNITFAVKHWGFSAVFGVIYTIAGWLLHQSVLTASSSNISRPLSFVDVAAHFTYSPIALVVAFLLVLGAYFYANDDPLNKINNGKQAELKSKPEWRYRIVGVTHALLHIAMIILTYYLYLQMDASVLENHWPFMLLIAYIVVGFFISGSLFGLYLIVANIYLKSHDNDAFAAIQCEDYKNFLRMHIDANKLTLYAVGIDKTVPWQYDEKKAVFVSSSEVVYKCIDRITISLET